ncbi:RagB/SusD family nutrient uptake outer membrane protein [Myroides marinus]|uniref:RagB/SusD family nutrient uptake outer membrane protein n=1 Tax=Myroides marinus TaxID=703342 RepID=UPI002577F17A|nr:RagB/SusD family nutrient uptake outer membrane protein [Myroides marinus]MDM1345475.1 RagB/SusD family nutrient uptake outer membrane protein [Myroides marinus]MDM1352710.1 RagB/SusD family nutrient uptake outer membrane protein [Myroides marinus]MDM1360062.1 RagB/SusD family nutrient uptake outer membrane protein [Myroides marinus]MDM1502881.1 RagB/SusD family nutrient uptake outer membrane protein [Myroides marinus]MDM1531096.1 RagB/SusD family nutrient uptake outer membrane protein [Myr
MKMINIKYVVLSVFLSLGISSCSLDTEPSDAIVDEKVFSTVEGNEKVLVGAWGYLMETFSTYANPGYGAFLRTNDAMGNDVVVSPKYGFRDHYAFTALYNRGGTNNFSWNLTYKTIDNANNVIEKVYTSTGGVMDKQRVRGQALALRGFMYLHLASSYAFAVDVDPNAKVGPIYLTPTKPDTKPRPAATVTEVYKQSISDLEEALTLIPTSYVRNLKYKFDRNVVQGLLARAYLYSHNWEKAAFYSDEVLKTYRQLMSETDYKAGFNDSSNVEWIWGHQQISDQSSASYQFHYLDVTSKESYYFSFNTDPYFKELFDDGDYRKGMIYWAPDPKIVNPQERDVAYMRYAKFKFKAGQIADIVLMRTSEMYLISAEAKARLGRGDAINQLNAVKEARGAKLASGLSGQALLEAIWIERRKELFGEGFARVDIVRNKLAVERKLYPQDLIDYEYQVMDNSGKVTTKTVKLLPQGHRITQFTDKTDFVPNSKYYLFRIPVAEEIENGNLYK